MNPHSQLQIIATDTYSPNGQFINNLLERCSQAGANEYICLGKYTTATFVDKIVEKLR